MSRYQRGVYPKAREDDAFAAIDQAKATTERAEADLRGAQEQLGPAGNDNPMVREALAKLARARFDLSRTIVNAPSRGVGVIAALVLFLAGAFLMRLLHVSAPSVSMAGGIVLMLIALKMAIGPLNELSHAAPELPAELDHKALAVYPLAVPYLLNPAGMVIVLVASSQSGSWMTSAVVVALILGVGAFDMLLFRNIDHLAKRMNPVTLVVSEVVFGILLTALAIEMLVLGLRGFGIIDAPLR